jgi:two-component system sensor histidine kinase KdpD
VFVVDPTRLSAPNVVDAARHPYGQTVGDRMRIGYGKLTIYLGSAAGSGKTFAMLDRAHDLRADGIDVVVGLVETHGRVDTEAKLGDLEVVPRLANGELDRAAILARRPAVVLIDELAHTNEPGSAFPKRYDDVIAILRQGISVMTTLNVQHLDGVGDAVERLTGTRVTPEVLRERLRDGKIYPKERIEPALANFFRVENLAALRELAVRELMRARRQRRQAPPFSRLVLGVRARERDALLIERMSRLAMRLSIELLVVHVAVPGAKQPNPDAVEHLKHVAQTARAAWKTVDAPEAASALIALITEHDVLVVESARNKQRPFGPPSFAARLLRSGAREMLVLAPH